MKIVLCGLVVVGVFLTVLVEGFIHQPEITIASIVGFIFFNCLEVIIRHANKLE